MAFKTNDYQQLTLNDNFINLTPRTQKIVMNSWCKDFSDIVFGKINEERFSVLYSDHAFSRPNTPVNIIIGALILKEINGLSDDELIEAICCDIRYQYALHTTHLKEQPISDRTFSRFRERLYHYELESGINLLEEEMKHLTSVFADYMNLKSNIKRMDSLMIASNCKRMSRLEILYKVTSNAVMLLHNSGNDHLIGENLKHYLDEEDYNDVIYYCKNEDVKTRLERIIKEAYEVKEIMSDEEWENFSEYMLLVRVLTEQTNEDKAPKANNEISSTSLQNPSDPDATYRTKAGKSHKGYVGNIVETVGENGDSLITEMEYEQNIHSDSEFCKEYIENKDNDEAEILITDGAYGGKENIERAKEKNIELITTSLTGKETNKIFGEFEISEDGKKVLKCPMGYEPIKTTHYPKTKMNRALFSKSCCENCPHREKCNVKAQKKNYAVHVSKSMVDRARYMDKLNTEEYKQLTRQRNAIEGIPSVLRRKYNIDNIPTFGLLRTRVFFIFKIGAYNFKKLTKYVKRVSPRGKSTQNLKIA